MYTVVATLILTLIFAIPLLGVAALWRLFAGPWWSELVLGVASPLLYVTLYVIVAGGLSLRYRRSVIPGRFPRDLKNPLYRGRRLYGLCWTAVYYFTPVYHVCLSIPPLKRLLFRLFGYRGSMKFTVYADTWIRDLPLLDFGEGAYVSNRATLGTNVARVDGSIQVDRISIGPRALVGHLSMVAFGTVLEEGAEVGVGCAVGSRCTLRKGAELAPCSVMAHLAELGERSSVAFMSFVGAAAVVGPGVRMPPVTQIPNRATVPNQAAADALLSATMSPLSSLATRLGPLLAKPPRDASLRAWEVPPLATSPEHGGGGNGIAAGGPIGPAPQPPGRAVPPPHEPPSPSEVIDGVPCSRWNIFE